MDILGTLRASLEVAQMWMARAWGSQTREQSQLEDAADRAAYEWKSALVRLKRATRAEEFELAVADLNYWDAELQRLCREAKAKYP